MTGLFFIVTLVAVVAAAVFAFQARAAAGAIKSLQDSAESARKEAEVARGKARDVEAELKTRAQQLGETREKLNEVRKKAQDSKAPRAATGRVREQELEEDLHHARELTQQAHGAEQTARKEAQAAKAEAAAREADVSRLQEKVRELTAQLGALPKPGAAVTTLPAAGAQEDAQVKKLERELEQARKEMQAKVEVADAQLKDEHKRVLDARDELKKAKGRAETNNRVYLVTKGELELTKERLAHAERRLWQSGIPLAPPEPKPRPKGKGPLAVDRPPGEVAQQAEGQAPAEAQPEQETQAEPAEPAQPAEPGELEAPRAAVVAPPSDEVLQRIGGPRRRRPGQEGSSAAPAAAAEDAEQPKH